MLKNKTKIIVLFLVLILLFSATFVYADNVSSDEGIMPISEDSAETVNPNARTNENNYKKSDVYLSGKDITIDYIVDGNLFVCADTVTINSQIGGDAFILAKNLIIGEQGYVFSNLFTISESIEIKGVVYDVFACSKNINISNGYVYRDIKALCDTLNVNGTVGRNAFLNCSNINFNTDKGTNGIIYGNLDYTSNSEISIPENVVSGTVNYTHASLSQNVSIQTIIANYILDLGEFIVFLLVIWLICLYIAPKFLDNTYTYVGKKTLGVLGCGLLTLVVVPIACIILVFLRLTCSISLFLLALYILAIILSKSLFTITANNYVCSRLNINKNLGIFGMLIISGAITWILTELPYIGDIVSFVITVLGLGILVVSILPRIVIKNTENKDNVKIENNDSSKETKDSNKVKKIDKTKKEAKSDESKNVDKTKKETKSDKVENVDATKKEIKVDEVVETEKDEDKKR